ncbi:MAG: hypothetical protein LBH51_01380 [Treponema sp.]|nr:hypothetical protein [Treponema sp.]
MEKTGPGPASFPGAKTGSPGTAFPRQALLYLIFLCAPLWSCVMPEEEGVFQLEFPPLPAAWTELLGEPRWLVQYYGEEGRESYLEGEEIPSLPPFAVGPVLAWPYWPLYRLEPGDFRPAGGILPYDGRPAAEDSGPRRLSLSWQGGVDAWFYQALSLAERGEKDSKAPGGGRNFNWPNFRALFSDPAVPQEIRDDPWRADWEDIAARTARSGFRKQWLKTAEDSFLTVPVHPGPWISNSPFSPALEFGAEPCVFPVSPGSAVHIWYSAQGILHCSEENWMLIPWE